MKIEYNKWQSEKLRGNTFKSWADEDIYLHRDKLYETIREFCIFKIKLTQKKRSIIDCVGTTRQILHSIK